MYETTNRVASRIADLRERLAAGQKPDGSPIDPEAVARLDASLALDPVEYFQYQEIKSRAQLQGVITTDEALTVYAALGGSMGSNGGWSASADTATKVIVTELIAQLIGAA